MADFADMASDREILDTDLLIRKGGYGKPLDKGYPGDCHLCGEWTSRLIEGVCAPCRDKYRLP